MISCYKCPIKLNQVTLFSDKSCVYITGLKIGLKTVVIVYIQTVSYFYKKIVDKAKRKNQNAQSHKESRGCLIYIKKRNSLKRYN